VSMGNQLETAKILFSSARERAGVSAVSVMSERGQKPDPTGPENSIYVALSMHCKSLWTPPFPHSYKILSFYFLVAGPQDLLCLCNTNPRVSS